MQNKINNLTKLGLGLILTSSLLTACSDSDSGGSSTNGGVMQALGTHKKP